MTLYKSLLHCYPDAFRARFADDMAADFDDGYDAARWAGALAAAFYVAAHEWPNGPVTPWFLWQVGVALTAGSVLAQGLLRINR